MQESLIEIVFRMKKVIYIIVFLLQIPQMYAAIPVDSVSKESDSLKYWKLSGKNSLHFNQMTLSNWASGGESSLAGKTTVNIDLDFAKNRINFDNNINLMYGIIGYQSDKIQKTDDKIEINNTFALKAAKKWWYSSMLNLRTQFSNGYKYPDDSTLISTFFAPAYLTLSLGMKYKPWEELLIMLSPASGKFTMVLDQELANKGSFGVTPAIYDTSGTVLSEGKRYKAEFGINVVVALEKEIIKNITAKSKLNLYNNYLDENFNNRWNIDINWESNITFAVNDHISTDLYLHMIYDHNINVPQYEVIDNERVKTGEGPRLQLKESMGIGLSFKF